MATLSNRRSEYRSIVAIAHEAKPPSLFRLFLTEDSPDTSPFPPSSLRVAIFNVDARTDEVNRRLWLRAKTNHAARIAKKEFSIMSPLGVSNVSDGGKIRKRRLISPRGESLYSLSAVTTHHRFSAARRGGSSHRRGSSNFALAPSFEFPTNLRVARTFPRQSGEVCASSVFGSRHPVCAIQ